MDSWEKAKNLGSLLSALLLPVVLLIVGNQLSSATKEREIESKFVELAAQILREQPTDETKLLRRWATQIIDRYSGVTLPTETATALIENTVLPVQATAPEPAAGPAAWAVVFGGDRTLDEARSEITIATSKFGIENAAIYLRRGSFRSVAVTIDRAAADDALGRIRERRDDSYIVNMNTWCPAAVQRDGYSECLSR